MPDASDASAQDDDGTSPEDEGPRRESRTAPSSTTHTALRALQAMLGLPPEDIPDDSPDAS